MNTISKRALASSGLCYVNDEIPGISRRKINGEFCYFLPDGKQLKDSIRIAQINSLAIPPAYTGVWICPQANGHLQATGRDARGRKQYRYHSAWRMMRDTNKYEHLLEFGTALPAIRRRVARDLNKPPLSRDHMLATIVRLLELTLIRVGNEEYARSNKSFGITTLRNRHVSIKGSKLIFRFRGKSGIFHEIALNDAKLARIVKRARDLPGQELFQYFDENGARHSVTSSDVNLYLQEAAGSHFTAKDFRTWAGTVQAADLLLKAMHSDSETENKNIVTDVVKQVAAQLGNTPAICRRCYIHPVVIEAFMNGSLPGLKNPSNAQEINIPRGLTKQERLIMRLLHGH